MAIIKHLARFFYRQSMTGEEFIYNKKRLLPLSIYG